MATRRESRTPKVRRSGQRRALVVTLSAILAIVLIGGGGAAIAVLLSRSTQHIAAPTQTPTVVPYVEPVHIAGPTPVPTPTPTVPLSPADIACPSSVTMSVWAHYDDDLIFMNPALQDAIARGDCIRTVFLTGADAGKGAGYGERRELGILRAYNVMRGQEGLWSEKRVTLLSGVVARQWSPDGNPNITVTFLRLPDGNLNGAGFPSTGNVSLPELLAGSVATLPTIDGQGPPVSLDALVATIAELIGAYHVNQLYTHVPGESTQWSPGDHPDHAATGSITRAAWKRAAFPAAQVNYLIGYPSMNLPEDLSGDPLTRKVDAFRTYAANDKVVACATNDACLGLPKFGQWLRRHYIKTEAELFPNG